MQLVGTIFMILYLNQWIRRPIFLVRFVIISKQVQKNPQKKEVSVLPLVANTDWLIFSKPGVHRYRCKPINSHAYTAHAYIFIADQYLYFAVNSKIDTAQKKIYQT